ncbi:hypothetical protein BDN71DRAFT_1428176 [Pleurotus eryngii]|uniref:Uncharacterized protein n=1 Tax=Pleurotus eryngii TaxID=5323 RepID=A0A9P6DAN1_PLEER|nr:hypothetical protein BDN71DRAFT_1428176 [Pleurotus eryngii]
MHLALKLASLATLAVMAVSSPASSRDVGANIVTDAELDDWLRTADANITFVGGAKGPLPRRNALIARVVYCTQRSGPLRGDHCTLYEGNSVCLNAPGTNCLMATTNVAFCNASFLRAFWGQKSAGKEQKAREMASEGLRRSAKPAKVSKKPPRKIESGTPPTDRNVPDPPVGTNAELDNWLRTRNANLIVGGDKKSLVDCNSQLATLVYRCCSTACGGECTIYREISTCINVPHADCLWTDFNVGYCARSSCVGSCHSFNASRTRYCCTLGTDSINVPFNL